MEVIQVTQEDGQLCAELCQFVAASSKLFDALKLAGMPVTGPGVGRREQAAAWLNSLATKMVQQLATPKVIASGDTTKRRKRGRGI